MMFSNINTFEYKTTKQEQCFLVSSLLDNNIQSIVLSLRDWGNQVKSISATQINNSESPHRAHHFVTQWASWVRLLISTSKHIHLMIFHPVFGTKCGRSIPTITEN